MAREDLLDPRGVFHVVRNTVYLSRKKCFQEVILFEKHRMMRVCKVPGKRGLASSYLAAEKMECGVGHELLPDWLAPHIGPDGVSDEAFVVGHVVQLLDLGFRRHTVPR